MRGIVDQIEGNFFVIEVDGIIRDIPKEQVAPGVSVNDTVELINGIWTKNEQLSKKRSENIKKLMDSLWED